jgi:hypothetical protein
MQYSYSGCDMIKTDIALAGDWDEKEDQTVTDRAPRVNGNLVFWFADLVKSDLCSRRHDVELCRIVIYPGALVEPLAYAYYANELSKEGYLVCILRMAFNLSILNSEKAGKFIQEHVEITSWYVAGHSMGGVSAASFAEAHLTLVSGVIFMASYPSASTDLSSTDLRVLSIYAELDGLTAIADIDASKVLLPIDTVYAEILGGNHAGFGMYGEQKYDNVATIHVLEQQNQMVALTLLFLNPE